MKDLLFFLKLFTPYKFWLIAGMLVALLTSLAAVSLLTLSGWFITSSAIAGILAPDGVAIAFNFIQPAAEIRALAIIRTFGRYSERLITHEATFRVLAEIRCWFFAKLVPLAPGRLGMKRSADLLSGITQDIDTLDALYLRLILPGLIAIIGSGIVIFFIATYSIKISLLALAMLILIAIFIPWFFNRPSQQGAKKIVIQTAKFKVLQIEMLQGIAELIAFGAYPRFKKQLLNVSKKMLETQTKNNTLSALSSAIALFLSQIIVLLSLIIGSILFQQGHISAAIFVMLFFCVLAVFELVSPLSSSIQVLTKTRAAIKRILHITQLTPTTTNPTDPQAIPAGGEIKISNLSFRYSNHSDWVLKNIDLKIPQGSKIAIVGMSGAGKTTLLQLLMRFYDPEKGKITYADIDFKQIQFNQLIKQYSFLSQQTQLFAATIKENLLIANPLASASELNQAVNLVGLGTMLNHLPRGINTWIGENGIKLSAGEGRRLALARAYLKNSPIILLDEPTEGLDKETEDEILNRLEMIAKNKTVVMVTHRKAPLRLVDCVYTFCDGRLK